MAKGRELDKKKRKSVSRGYQKKKETKRKRDQETLPFLWRHPHLIFLPGPVPFCYLMIPGVYRSGDELTLHLKTTCKRNDITKTKAHLACLI